MDSKNLSQLQKNGLYSKEKEKEKAISYLKENFCKFLSSMFNFYFLIAFFFTVKNEINISSYGEILCALQSMPDDLKLSLKLFVQLYIKTYMSVCRNTTQDDSDTPTVTEHP